MNNSQKGCRNMNLEELDFKIREIKTGVIVDFGYIDNIYPMEGMVCIITRRI